MADESEPLNLEVLIADDDPIARDILQAYLETLGCRVRIAQDGHQTIKAMKYCADWTDVVVLDAHMPGPSPCELYEQVRAVDPSVPILICSALSDWDSRLDFIVERGLTLLMKPFRRADLRQAMEIVLGEHAAAALR